MSTEGSRAATASALALFLLAALLGAGCEPAAEPQDRPNVLLVVFDTTRFDDWSFLELERRVTPGSTRSAHGRSLLPLLRVGASLQAPRPYSRSGAIEDGVGNLIRGQDPATRERLEEELRALGYVE